jgi:hypothetical protein
MRPQSRPVRIGIVLSAGGLRGVAHLGVMRRLVASGVRFDVVVGVSAGAIIAGYYAGVGLSIEDMIADAPTFQGRHLVMHGMTLRAPASIKPLLQRFCGVIPGRLAQLDSARFDRLHHGVQSLGIVCHDRVAEQSVASTHIRVARGGSPAHSMSTARDEGDAPEPASQECSRCPQRRDSLVSPLPAL